MKANGQITTLTRYVSEHPGCYLSEILRDTQLPKCSVTSALTKLNAEGILRREGFDKRYRYYPAATENIEAHKSKRRPEMTDSDRINPLTNLFNQRLKEIRSGR